MWLELPIVVVVDLKCGLRSTPNPGSVCSIQLGRVEMGLGLPSAETWGLLSPDGLLKTWLAFENSYRRDTADDMDRAVVCSLCHFFFLSLSSSHSHILFSLTSHNP